MDSRRKAARRSTRSTRPPRKSIASVAEGDAADIDLAVKAARKAFDGGEWSRWTPATAAG